jgi:AraC-like DNA-binding protein
MNQDRHVEFLNRAHFEQHYDRLAPPATLEHFIDFFWETKFENLWSRYPDGFTDILFPNVGYTYLINLGTPFTMLLDDEPFEVRLDSFLPRNKTLASIHSPGNHIFGIKFKISPVLFEKKLNFSEYRGQIVPLTYLVDKQLIDAVKAAPGFEERAAIATTYYQDILHTNPEPLQAILTVKNILDNCKKSLRFGDSVAQLAAEHNISARTLQRYFDMTTSISGKKALQIMRIRMATAMLAEDPAHFEFTRYGYFDRSHFIKHLKQFLKCHSLTPAKPHLKLLAALHKEPMNP